MIALAADHGGYTLKEEIKGYLQQEGYEIRDFGTGDCHAVDYPDYALTAALAIARGECEKGILICGTGIGMSIAANKVPGIRAALCHDAFSARMSRAHNHANILCLGQRVIGAGLAMEIVQVWLKGAFDGGRHENRLAKIARFEGRGDLGACCNN